MKLTPIVVSAIAVVILTACQPASPPAESSTTPQPDVAASATAEEVASTTGSAESTGAPALPCGIIAQRDWHAQASGSPGSLVVSGEIDLATPGFGVSLARDNAEAPGAQSTTLTLQLRSPAGGVAQVVTPHPVRYFGPARGPYETVHIVCDGAELTRIEVTR